MEKIKTRTAMNILTAIVTLACMIFIAYGIKMDLFYSETALKTFLTRFGIWAPIIFVVFQALQVVFPILPGGIGLLGGVLIFGSLRGFVLNYLGICIGSILAFLTAKHYGTPIIESLFSPKVRNKYMKWSEDKKFPALFAVAIFMPVAPDDFLCYLAGTTKMSFKRFLIIILLGKPLTIAIYSFGLNVIFQHLAVLVQ